MLTQQTHGASWSSIKPASPLSHSHALIISPIQWRLLEDTRVGGYSHQENFYIHFNFWYFYFLALFDTFYFPHFHFELTFWYFLLKYLLSLLILLLFGTFVTFTFLTSTLPSLSDTFSTNITFCTLGKYIELWSINYQYHMLTLSKSQLDEGYTTVY